MPKTLLQQFEFRKNPEPIQQFFKLFTCLKIINTPPQMSKIRPFWIRNLGPSASGAGSQYDQLLQGCLRTCELYQLRKITVIGQLQNLEIDFTLFRTINQTAIPPAEFIQVKHMQSGIIGQTNPSPSD